MNDLRTTPDYIFEWAQDLFKIKFDVDLAASCINTKCQWYFDDDGEGGALTKSWGRYTHGWLNPPYSNIPVWLTKVERETMAHPITVVCLLPVDTSTLWYRDHVHDKAASVVFITGRIQFGNGKQSSNKAGSMFVMYNQLLRNVQGKTNYFRVDRPDPS